MHLVGFTIEAACCRAGSPLLNTERQYLCQRGKSTNKQTPVGIEVVCYKDQLEGLSTTGTVRLEADNSSVTTCAGANLRACACQ